MDLFSDAPSNVTIPEGTHGDLNGDGIIDFDDRVIWVTDVNGTVFGDSNLDGVFNSTDLVAIFSAGEFEDDTVKNSTWADGDWNGDWEFTTSDLVLAFKEGGYTAERRTHDVPEPNAIGVIWLLAIYAARRRIVLAASSLTPFSDTFGLGLVPT